MVVILASLIPCLDSFVTGSSSMLPFIRMPSFNVSFQPAQFSGDDNKYVHKKGVQVLTPDMVTPSMSVELLDAWNDDYNGVIIEPTSLPSSANTFASVLRASLSYWESKVLCSQAY